MKGLDFGLLGGGIHASLVVARDSVLVTNGMDQYGEFFICLLIVNVLLLAAVFPYFYFV
jgi:hypothetical protein